MLKLGDRVIWNGRECEVCELGTGGYWVRLRWQSGTRNGKPRNRYADNVPPSACKPVDAAITPSTAIHSQPTCLDCGLKDSTIDQLTRDIARLRERCNATGKERDESRKAIAQASAALDRAGVEARWYGSDTLVDRIGFLAERLNDQREMREGLARDLAHLTQQQSARVTAAERCAEDWQVAADSHGRDRDALREECNRLRADLAKRPSRTWQFVAAAVAVLCGGAVCLILQHLGVL